MTNLAPPLRSSVLSSAAHPLRQFIWHVRAGAQHTPPPWLTDSEAALFSAMVPADQLEGLAVAATLQSWGWDRDRDLLVAALLHDAGKALAPPAVRYRVAMTLLEHIAPWLLPAATARSAPLAALSRHAEAGARMAAEAGLSTEVQRLIAGHHSTPISQRMAALQRADRLH